MLFYWKDFLVAIVESAGAVIPANDGKDVEWCVLVWLEVLCKTM